MTTEGSHPILGTVVIASQVSTSPAPQRRTRNIALPLTANVAIVATGSQLLMPIFARRLGEFGSGVEALGLMSMSYAVAAFLAAPVMGSLADRYGRRPVIIGAFAAYTAAGLGFLFARSTETFLVVRMLQGAFTAGLMPAAMGVVADTSPESTRGRWVAVLMAGTAFGFVFGPVIGGFLYDSWGFQAPFIASSAMALCAFLAATVVVQETRTPATRRREALLQRRLEAAAQSKATSLWESLPKPLYVFATLLSLDFIITFAFGYLQPQMIFYLYEDLGWSTVQFGVVAGAFGISMVLFETVLGPASDKLGRMPVIVVGVLLFTALPIGLAFITSFYLLLATASAAGAGFALVSPALGAAYLDIAVEQHRSRTMGIKLASGSLGGVFGPLALVGVRALTTPRGIFISAGGLLAFAALLALAVLPVFRRGKVADVKLTWHPSESRTMAAQLTLRGVAVRATMARLNDTTW